MTFVLGLRMDIVLLSYSIGILFLLALILPDRINRWIKYFYVGYASIFFTFFAFMELATIPFLDQYDLRPDTVFFEYLKYPVEVGSMLIKDYPFTLIISNTLVAIIAYLFFKSSSKVFDYARPNRWWVKLLILPIFAALIFIGARSSFGHRPANISTASFSNNHLVNEITLNSPYSLLYALYRLKHEGNSYKLYGKLPEKEVFQRVKKASRKKALFNIQHSIKTKKKPNIVVILLESFGAEYSGVLGGLPLTPHFDKLSSEGMLFTDLYATGTRSVRGIEALITGFPPTPGRSVVKLSKSRKNFFSIASLLKEQGYHTEFMYGGESNFDEMRAFFLGNGFDQIYDQGYWDSSITRGVWGIDDDSLFQEANKILRKHKKPFFSLIFSSSNHSPFDFPDGKVEYFNHPKGTHENATKFVDYAIGRYFAQAKKENYYKNTIFLVVADHNTRVFGDGLVPIYKFRISGLLMGPKIPKMHYNKVASHIDIMPTLLHFTGLPVKHPMIGYNLMKLPSEEPGRALMQYGLNFGYMKGDKVVVIKPHQKPKGFLYKDKRLTPNKLDPQMAKDALAHSLWAWLMYDRKKYTLYRSK